MIGLTPGQELIVAIIVGVFVIMLAWEWFKKNCR